MREAKNMGTVTTFEKNLPQKAPETGEGRVGGEAGRGSRRLSLPPPPIPTFHRQ